MTTATEPTDLQVEQLTDTLFEVADAARMLLNCPPGLWPYTDATYLRAKVAKLDAILTEHGAAHLIGETEPRLFKNTACK